MTGKGLVTMVRLRLRLDYVLCPILVCFVFGTGVHPDEDPHKGTYIFRPSFREVHLVDTACRQNDRVERRLGLKIGVM